MILCFDVSDKLLTCSFYRNSYSLKDGTTFAEQAKTATFDLAGDEAVADRQRRNSQLKWDRKKKKFVKGDGAGADNMKIVKTEGGTRLPATYRSGRFDEWKARTHTRVPRVGEAEAEGMGRRGGAGAKRFKHQKVTAAKPLDKLSKDYERKTRQLKKGRESGGEPSTAETPSRGHKGTRGRASGGQRSRYGGKPMGRVKSELKSADQIRKTRELTERKRLKNARPSRKGRR